METIIKKISFAFIFLGMVFLIAACKEDNQEELDECEETKWPEPKHYHVQPKIRVYINKIQGFDLKNAEVVHYSGATQKIYCPDVESTLFQYTPSEFYPEFIEEQYWSGGFLIGESFGFFFNNDMDYLDVYLSFHVYFNNFDHFTGDKLIKVKPDDIYKDINNLKDFFFFDITSDIYWTKQ